MISRLFFLFLFLLQSALLPYSAANGFKTEKTPKENSHSKKESKGDFAFLEEIEEDESEKTGFPILSYDSHKSHSNGVNWLVSHQTSKQTYSYSLAPQSLSILIWIQNFRI